LAIILGMRAILWPRESPKDGQTVRRRLFAFLDRKLARAPQRGRGAYLRRFLENAIKVSRSYARGLFHCFDNPLIPHTTNLIENRNGAEKRNLRRCSGATSTASGPGSSYGRFYAFAVVLNLCLNENEVNELVAGYDLGAYREARRTLNEVHARAFRRRAFLRDPQKHLDQILAEWYEKDIEQIC